MWRGEADIPVRLHRFFFFNLQLDYLSWGHSHTGHSPKIRGQDYLSIIVDKTICHGDIARRRLSWTYASREGDMSPSVPMTQARHHVMFVPCSLCSRVPFPCWNLCYRVVFPCSLCSLVIPDFSFLVVCVPVLHFPVPCFSVPFPGGIRQCSFIYSVVFISYHRLLCLSLQESRSIPKIWFLQLRDILRTGFSSARRNLRHWNSMTLSIYLHIYLQINLYNYL